MLGLSHRVLVMRLGAIVAEFEGGEATEESVMRAAFATEPAERGQRHQRPAGAPVSTFTSATDAARRRWLRRPDGGYFGFLRDYAIVVSFLALFITLTLASSPFFTTTNLSNVLDQSSTLGIIACGETIVFIAGGFDLSVGAIYGLSGVVAALLQPHIGSGAALAAGLLVGGICGLANGLLVTVGRINSFMATIGSGFVIEGIALVLTQGNLINVISPSFAILGENSLFGITYATGLADLRRDPHPDPEGDDVRPLRLRERRQPARRAALGRAGQRDPYPRFTISGLSAGLAGIILTSRVQTGQADDGTNIELTIIAAVVIGGTSIFGGEGAIWRSVLGIILLTLIGNGFDLLNVNPVYQQVIQGLIILVAVGIDAWSRTTA